jgi:acetyl esterase/lipase
MPNRSPDLTMPLWTEVPAKRGETAEDNPWLELYRPANPTGAAVLVCPGGGYQGRAPHEAGIVAEWLNTLGITGIVVHYRVKPYQHPQPLNDLSQAMRLARQHAGEWNIDPQKIGVLGFSAGGHLAATLSTHYTPETRPAFSILLYPVITLNPPSAHTGSRNNLLVDPTDQKQVNELSNDQHVTPDTPPAFLFHTVTDQAVPVENAILYASALRRNGVRFEMHIYEEGQHGVGLATDHPVLHTWPALCGKWLKSRGWAVE